MRAASEYFHAVVNPAVACVQESLEQGRPVGLTALFVARATDFYAELARDPDRGPIFEEFMTQYSATNHSRVAGMRVFAEARHVLDVGGNLGGLALELAARHPHIEVTVVDLPEVVAKTRERFSSSDWPRRLHVVAADIRRDSFPLGHDCVVFSHLLDIFAPDENLDLLRRAYEALDPGGQVCVLAPIVSDDETGPFANAVFSCYFLALAGGRGRCYSVRAITSWLRASGYLHSRCTACP